MESSARPCLSLPIAPLAAAALGGAVALLLLAAPSVPPRDWLAVAGLAGLLPASLATDEATRILFVAVASVGATLIAWFGLFLLLGGRTIVFQRGGAEGADQAPVLRRADAHPDAPARRPLSASRELGTPFLEVCADRPVQARAPRPVRTALSEPPRERDLPGNLDLPLAAFDPQAIPETPIEWFVPPMLRKARRRALEEASGFRPFELPSAIAPVAAEDPRQAAGPAEIPVLRFDPAQPFEAGRAPAGQRGGRQAAHGGARHGLDASASIHALLDRLERDIGPCEPSAPVPTEESMHDAFATLKRIAARG